jgi:hypothetical protein
MPRANCKYVSSISHFRISITTSPIIFIILNATMKFAIFAVLAATASAFSVVPLVARRGSALQAKDIRGTLSILEGPRYVSPSVRQAIFSPTLRSSLF